MSRDQCNRAGRRSPATFRCPHCRFDVPIGTPGTRHPNHCPNCLCSQHLDDDVPVDRNAHGSASMAPIAICVREDGEWALVHHCGGCATVHLNHIANDDNPLLLVRLAIRPLAQQGPVFSQFRGNQ